MLACAARSFPFNHVSAHFRSSESRLSAIRAVCILIGVVINFFPEDSTPKASLCRGEPACPPRVAGFQQSEYLSPGRKLVRPYKFDFYNNKVSTRCACTISSQGDQAKTVKRPSWEATRAMASRCSCINCAADKCLVPPFWAGWTTTGLSPTIGSVATICSTAAPPSRRPILAPKASTWYWSLIIVAPSTAVSPATVSTARRTAASNQFSLASLTSCRISSASAENGGVTE